ncbi:hypothetical protein C4573_03280 [Candidatus Woesearchaeota archaeon]|nr:MAG: hypothetical protein C4573_03280 [Candidatus Woesearchaeota archaeon]
MQGLKEIGLSDNEIKVFLELNKEGSRSVWDVATKTKIKRTTTYDVIKSLIQKNLVSVKNEDKKQLYFAVEPNVLLEQINLKKDILTQTVDELIKIRKEFVAESVITKFNGVEGIRTAMNMLLLNKKDIYGWGNNKLSEKILSFYPENFAQKRIDKKVKLFAIIEPGKKFFANNDSFSKTTEIRHHIMMKNQNVVYFIQEGKVLFLKMNALKPEVVVIEDEEYYKSQKELFDYLWSNSKD